MNQQSIFRLFLGLLSVLLLGNALTYLLKPQFIYDQGDTHILITYSNLNKIGCVDVMWTTSHINAIYIGGMGTIGEGQRTVCDTLDGSTLRIDLASGESLEYSRDMLWQSITTRIWFAIVCLSIVLLWPRQHSLWLAGAILIVALGVWSLQGFPSLPLNLWFKPFSAPSPTLRQIFILAVFVPLIYWSLVPSRMRVIFLLGVGLFTLVWYGVAYEYIALLGVLIVWLYALTHPTVTLEKQVNPGVILLCGLCLILFAVAVVASTNSWIKNEMPLASLSPLFASLVIGFLALWVWKMSRRPFMFILSKCIIGASLILLIFYHQVFPAVLDEITIYPVSTIFVPIAALILIVLAFEIGMHLSPSQRKGFINGGILYLLGIFIVFKWPQGQILGWLGFSYTAFRLLHIALEYRKNTPIPALSLPEMTVYTTFFPAQLVGPIDLVPHFAPQMRSEQVFSWNDYGEGWQRILWGAIKKFFIADVLLSVLIPGTVPISYLTPAAAWAQIYAYAFYIYCDFSGFVDIALGLARLLGYRLPENFDAPYTKGSLAQFWQSWHITLSSWIRTYVYLPLSRTLLRTRLKRSSLSIVLIANLVTMLLIGLWHGLTLNFIIWGIWHAVGLFIHKAFSDQMRRRQIQWRGTWKAQVFHGFSVFLTFHFVVLGWVFFALPNPEASLALLKKLGGLS